MGICMATGEVAGVAAAQSIKENVSLKDLGAEKVRKALIEKGARL